MSKADPGPARVPEEPPARRRPAWWCVSGATTILASERRLGHDARGAGRRTRPRCCSRMTRQLYPHDDAGRHLLRRGGRGVRRQGRRPTRSSRALVKDGVAELDAGLGRALAQALAPARSSRCWRRSRTARSSRRVRGHTVVALYNNKNVWPNFGYQGSSAAGRRLPLPRLPGRGLDDAAGRRGEPAGVPGLSGRTTTMATLRPQRRRRRRHRRLRRRRRHARQRAVPEGHQRRAARGRQAGEHRQLRQRRVGAASSSSPGSTSAPPRAPGGSPRTSRTCRPGSARPSAAPPRTGPAPRCASRSTSSRPRSVYGEIPGANLLDWPLTLAELEPYYARAEDKMGVTRTNGIPGLPGNNNFKVLLHRRQAARLQGGPYRPHGDQQRAARRPAVSCQQIGFCFQGCKSAAKWSTLYTEIPAAEATGKLELRPECQVLQIQHDDAGKVTGVLYADKDGKQHVAEGARRLRRRQLDREPAAAAELGLGQVPGRARQQLGPGRPQLHAAHDRLGLRRVRQARAHVPRHDHGRHHPGRGAATTRARGFVGGYEMETLSLGLPFMAAFLDPGAWGREFTRKMEQLPEHGRHVDRRRGHAAGDQPGHAARRPRRTSSGMPIPNVHFDDHPNDIAMRSHAFRRARRSTRRRVPREVYETPPYPSTHNLGTNRMSANAARRRGQQVGPDPRHQEPVRLRRQPVHDRRGREPDADDRDAGDPAGRLHRRADGQGRNLIAVASQQLKPDWRGLAALITTNLR